MPISRVTETVLEQVHHIRFGPEPDTVTIIHEREQHPGEAPETPTLWPEATLHGVGEAVEATQREIREAEQATERSQPIGTVGDEITHTVEPNDFERLCAASWTATQDYGADYWSMATEEDRSDESRRVIAILCAELSTTMLNAGVSALYAAGLKAGSETNMENAVKDCLHAVTADILLGSPTRADRHRARHQAPKPSGTVGATGHELTKLFGDIERLREDMAAMVRRVRTLESQADQQRLQCNGDLVKLTSEMKQLSATVGNLMKRAVVLEEFAAGLYEGAKHAALDTES